MRRLSPQALKDLVEGAAIFSAGGGGDTRVGHDIVSRLVSDNCRMTLIDPAEVPNERFVLNFACVGATASVKYDSEAALRTFELLEEFLDTEAFAAIPVELGGLNTLAAVDVAARRGIPVVDADGAGRSVPEVHLKVYAIDNIPLAPMAIADVDAQNMLLVKRTRDAISAEGIARVLAAKWSNVAYTARRPLTGAQVRTSPVLNTLSTSIRIGMLLKKAVDPIGAVLRETGGFRLFEGIVNKVGRETKGGFTWTSATLRGAGENRGSEFSFKAKNEILIAYKDGEVAAVAPDIITALHPETGKCITAEKIAKGDKLVVIGVSAPEKWRTPKGLELWEDVLQRSAINARYTTIEELSC